MNMQRKKVLSPMKNEKTGKTYWLRLGHAFTNRDGSTNVYLDAFPSNRKLQIRDLDEDDLRPRNRRDGDDGAQPDDASSDIPF